MNQFHLHSSSHAQPPATALTTATQSGLILEADLKTTKKLQRPLTVKTVKRKPELHKTVTASTAIHTGKILSPAAHQRAQSYRK